MLKKSLSFMLVCIMIFTIIIGTAVSVTAYRSSISASEVVSYMNGLVGQPNGYVGLCLKFVSVCWENMGFQGSYNWENATNFANNNRVSYSRDNIPVGADVFFSSSDGNGHIGIYVGDGYFVHAGSKSYYEKSNLSADYWYNHYTGWGWHPYVSVINDPDFTPVYMGERFFANIIHSQSGKAVVAVGDNAGDNVVLETLDGKLLHKWEFIHQGNNEYKIVNNHSGKCLDVSAGKADNGTNIATWDDLNNTPQRWYFKPVGNGYSLVPKCAMNSCLDLDNGYISEGTNIQLWESWGGSNQVFTLNYLPSFVAQNLGKHFYANIVHLKSDKPVVAVGDNNGDNVELGEFSGEIIKKWEFIRQNDWSYKIVNNHSGKCLDVNGAGSENMTNIHVWESNSSYAQLWYLKQVGGGYSLVPKCALNSALDLEDDKTVTGTNISLHQQISASAQIYYFNYQPADIAISIGDSFDAWIIHHSSGYAVSYNQVGNAVIFPNDISSEQKWHFERQKDNSYIIKNPSTGLFLSVDKQYDCDGANVQIDPSNSSNGQKWYIIKNGAGYSFVPKCAVNRAIDLKDGIIEKSNLVIYGLEHNNTNQIFIINQYVFLQPDMVTVSDVVTTSDATAVNPTVTVKVDGKTLTKNTDYTVDVAADIASGAGTVTVTGKGAYTGTVTKSFKITIDDRNTITDSQGHTYKADQGEIVTFIIRLTSPTQVNHLNGVLYYNQDIMEPIITDDMRYHTPAFSDGQFRQYTPGQIEFDIFSDSPVKLNNTTVLRMQFRVTAKGGQGWLSHEFRNPEFTWDNINNYGLETKVLTNQELYVPSVKVLGDVDGDGEATIIDATYIQRYNVNMQIPISEETLKICGDVDGDDEVTVIDATFIQRYDSKIKTPYSIGEPIS